MHKNATKCNKTQSKWCVNKHGASKIIDTFETYQGPQCNFYYVWAALYFLWTYGIDLDLSHTKIFSSLLPSSLYETSTNAREEGLPSVKSLDSYMLTMTVTCWWSRLNLDWWGRVGMVSHLVLQIWWVGLLRDGSPLAVQFWLMGPSGDKCRAALR
jgi:hypothetical protein